MTPPVTNGSKSWLILILAQKKPTDMRYRPGPVAESTLEIPKTERYTCRMSSQLLMSGPKILKRLLLLLDMPSSEILMPIEERIESNEVCQ